MFEIFSLPINYLKMFPFNGTFLRLIVSEMGTLQNTLQSMLIYKVKFLHEQSLHPVISEHQNLIFVGVRRYGLEQSQISRIHEPFLEKFDLIQFKLPKVKKRNLSKDDDRIKLS